jgi:hypothetical protein
MSRLEDSGMSSSEAASKLHYLGISSDIETLLWAITGTLFSVGAVSLIWELLMRTSWLAFVREGIAGALAEPATVDINSKGRQEEHLLGLLRRVHGDALGEAIFRESTCDAVARDRLRKDFEYVITLRPGNHLPLQFFSAHLSISFTLERLPSVKPAGQKVHVGFRFVQRDRDFHAEYERKNAAERLALYRYILLTDYSPLAADADLSPWFKVSSCSFQEEAGPTAVSAKPATARLEDGGWWRIDLEPTSIRKWNKIARTRRPCKVRIEIETLVDQSRPEFPIALGYPVLNFRSRLNATQVNVQKVEVLEFFTTPGRFEPYSTTVVPGEAGGRLDDFILPDSGLTYSWRS